MSDPTAADPILIRYLLGELTPDEEVALDERAFVDDAWDEERATAADDLIDAYLSGALTADQRQRFEAHFLASSEHRERFRLLRDLRTVVASSRSGLPGAGRTPSRAGLVWAVAAAVIAALAALVLLMSGPAPKEPRFAGGSTAPPSRTPTPSPSPSVSPGVPSSAGTAAVSLPERPQPTRIPLDASFRVVRFTIPLPAEGPDAYIAKVRRDGRTVWEEGDLEASAGGSTLVVDVPAQVLAGESVALVLEPDTTRSTSPRPAASERVWPLRLVRPEP